MQDTKKKLVLNRTKEGSHVDIFLIFAIVIVVVILSLGSLLTPDRQMSENENRYLTQAPELTVSNILEGKYESQLEEYLSDQIIGREKWIKIMSTISKSVGFTDVNGVYLMSDGRLIERKTEAEFNAERYKSNLDQIVEMNEEVSEAGTEVRVMLIPTAAYSYRNEANMSTNFDEGSALKIAADTLGEIYVDLSSCFEPDKEHKGGYYYMTDHHWNYDGAEKAAEIYREALGLSPKTYEPETLTKEFKGTLYSKVLLSDRIRDAIDVPKDSLSQKVSVSIEGDTYDSIYFMDRLENKDKYEVFFGGNYDRVDIRNEAEGASRKPRLLIIKDSYANSFVPFILDDFSEITMVDTRYYRDSVKDLALDDEYDQVLVLYSTSNFSEERMDLNNSVLQ
ncbi:MAG: hypothetical protein IKS99_02175 [Firmicutes bacterium]|nr:hypothetical protein [Bacillota bacterium]